MTDRLEALRAHFRQALPANPVDAYRDWFRAQEELRGEGDSEASRALADDLWETLPHLTFESAESQARFSHNVAVFFGSPGPTADLARARAGFQTALAHFAAHGEDGWRARVLHNLATAISNLGTTASELEESVGLFDRALEWRTPERSIARAVTLHNQGLAYRRLAELAPAHARAHGQSSAACLREAVALRESNGLAEGRAASERELRITLERLGG